jgi:predicted dienelactone hydrolase
MRRIGLALAVVALGASTASALSDTGTCLAKSGRAGLQCLQRYTKSVATCRNRADAACEADLRVADGPLDAILARPATDIATHCDEANAVPLGYLFLDDIDAQIPAACADWADDLAGVSRAAARCQKTVATRLRVLGKKTVRAFGPSCFVDAFEGKGCDRVRRDARVATARGKAVDKIVKRCGAEFDSLGLVSGTAGALADRVGSLADVAVTRARHFALRVYPPNDLGPSTEFGPAPIGITTLQLSDPARLNVAGTGPRPVTVEVYYPSTEAAVAGVPRDVAVVLGISVLETPAYRDVALAPGGPRPLVLFSHGNNGLRIQSFFFAAHLASHGYIVVAPDHHGNTFVDTLGGTVDAQSSVNRPRDMSFLIDTFLAFNADPGSPYFGAIDGNAVGASGHSFGGYTTFALAGGAFGLGTFTDARVKAIFPQAPAAGQFSDAFFSTISVPTLIVGGSIDETTPAASSQQRPFDHLPSGAAVVGYGNLTDAGHFTFSDFCEVPRALLAFLGGFEEACEPRHLPWRHAHDIVNYLSLNFFDATLRGDAAALARLAPSTLASIEDLTYQSK